MFRDAKAALERLEAELLQDDDANDICYEALPDELLDEAVLDSLLEDTQRIGNAENAALYKNYSNGYTAYNADRTDETPDDLSDALLNPRRDRVITALSILALILLSGILGVLIWILLLFRGVLG